MKKRLNTEFYHAIDVLCIDKHITHRELAEKVGVSEVTLSRYLTGERLISLSVFMGICKVFDIKAEDLYKTYMFSNMRQRVERYRKEHESLPESEG